MALTNYTELQASVADFLNRGDLTSVIPDFITMTESEFNRTLRVSNMSVRTRAPLNTQYLKLPDGFIGMRNIDLLTDPVTPLSYKNLQNLDIHRANDATGKPLYYSILQNNIEFAPVPDGAYTLEIVYYQKVPPLSVNTTNWLLDNHPDAYLYGSLMHSAPYLQADERAGLWAGKYNQIIQQITSSDEKAKFSGSTPSVSFTPFG
tara:strand:+ start:15631 stop:16245 length:615 start_codon:yes stop_codon:yes gene_type:complete